MKVLFLVESGSRGWGWESKDSDYDMRGVFIQNYNKLGLEPDQIDRKIGEFDITLWDLKKFLKLMIDSNPSCWEWLSSDVVYIDNPIRKRLKGMFEYCFSEDKLKQHYVSMAKNNFYKYINNIGDTANLKKYIYVLRSIACILWIENFHTPPPKQYTQVINLLPEDIKAFALKVISDKKESESLEGPRNKEVEKYIISFFDKKYEDTSNDFDITEIEEVLKDVLDG